MSVPPLTISMHNSGPLHCRSSGSVNVASCPLEVTSHMYNTKVFVLYGMDNKKVDSREPDKNN